MVEIQTLVSKGNELTEERFDAVDDLDSYFCILVKSQVRSAKSALEADIGTTFRVLPQKYRIKSGRDVIAICGTHDSYVISVRRTTGNVIRIRHTEGSSPEKFTVSDAVEDARSRQFMPKISAKAKTPTLEIEGSAEGVGHTDSTKSTSTRSLERTYQQLTATPGKAGVTWTWTRPGGAWATRSPVVESVNLDVKFNVSMPPDANILVRVKPGEVVYYADGHPIDLHRHIALRIALWRRCLRPRLAETVPRPPSDDLELKVTLR